LQSRLPSVTTILSATTERQPMNVTTIVIILVILLVLGGGWGYSRRGRM
jgi:hypothetical protein